MADPAILTPVEGDDPCGEDLRWDMEFMTVMQEFESIFLQDQGSVVEDAATTDDAPEARDFIDRVNGLCTRTKDLRLLGARAEALWRSEGLAAFADALEDMVAAVEEWPDPASGIHPRADEFDGDLAERTAPLSRLLTNVPVVARSVGWGAEPSVEQRQAVAETLKGVFDSWTARLEPAFDRDLPSRNNAWEAIRPMLAGAASAAVEAAAAAEAGGDATGSTAGTPAPPPADAWELIERAAELMATQDRHSPALPLLRLLLVWRSKGILEIAESMKTSGMTMEQFLDSTRKQLAAD